MKLMIIALFVVFTNFAFAAEPKATIITDMGTITIKLYTPTHPVTDNFIQLAKGTARYTDVNNVKATKPFYDGLIFHRVHPDLGIFSGCPWGNGRGWPGYFVNEKDSKDSVFDRPGLVAMAKINGDERVGSQFFITTKADTRLNGRYPIFGEVIKGLDIVELIAKAPRDVMMKPKKAIHIKK